MKINIICANTDLGVHVNGANLGPKKIVENLNNNKINKIINVDKENIVKSIDKLDLRKNEKEVNNFSKKLFDQVKNTCEDDIFPITLGGDHTVAIASSLASNTVNGPLGCIWIDAHSDYHSFSSTTSGNLHGLPFAALSGFTDTDDLTKHLTNKTINQNNCVLIGGRSIDPGEVINLKNSGVTIFYDSDIEKYGIEYIMNEAFKIASKDTNGIHVSYDLDVINPLLAPGVSVPEKDGFDLETTYKVADILSNNLDKIKSFDLVEYNPLKDKDNVTLDIALNILNKIIEKR